MKTIKCLIIAMVTALVIARVSYGQMAIVTGTVTRSDGTPLVRVIVRIDNKFNFTDLTGRYYIKEVPFGKHLMTITQKGKVLWSEEIPLDKQLTNRDIKIQ